MSDAPEVKKPKSRKKMAIIAILALGVIGGAGGFLSPTVLASGGPADEAQAESHGEDEGGHGESASGEHGSGPVIASLDVGRIVVNLEESGSASKHLVIETVVQYDASALGASPDLEMYKLQVRDAFIGYLANISESEVRGSSGMSNLREELLRRARVAFSEGEPTALLIQNYVLQ